MTEHPPLEVLADAAEGLLDPAVAAAVARHLAGCSDCRAEAEALAEVGRTLSEAPAPPMPAAVAGRLSGVLADEQRRRVRLGALHAVDGAGGDPVPATPGAFPPDVLGPPPAVPEHPYGTAARPRPGLGRFGADLHRVSAGRRWAVPAVAAAAAAAVIGFGTYVLSASAGLNEPPAVSVSVNAGELGAQATALRRSDDLQPHRFSQAWWCARRATDGRIVALAATTDAGRPALLVYLRTGAGTSVTVVTGCETPDPAAGPLVALNR